MTPHAMIVATKNHDPKHLAATCMTTEENSNEIVTRRVNPPLNK